VIYNIINDAAAYRGFIPDRQVETSMVPADRPGREGRT
jgi:hypothetical protein